MPSISALPTEILCEILSFVEQDRNTLLSLSSTNRAIHNVARDFVFHSCHDVHGNRLQLLNRSLQSAPELKAVVLSYGPLNIEADGYILLEDLELLETLIKLKRLDVQVGRLPEGKHKSIFLLESLGQIEEMQVVVPASIRQTVPHGLLKALMVLPKLRVFEVKDILRRLSYTNQHLSCTERW